ncbi:ATP-dependent RecD-like DNA helicase [Bacteroidota bacterium]
MLKNHISDLITQNFDFSPTKGQEILIEKLADFVSEKKTLQILLVNGYAGTGKTSIVSAFVKTLGKLQIKSVLLAPTGRAAKVLMNYTSKNANTIHKKIYRQKSSKDGFGEFSLDKNLHKNTFFIIDESSMITNDSGNFSIFGSGRLLDDLITYVYNENNCKLILLGDTAQLPPVGLDISPALNEQKLEEYDLEVIQVKLDEVMRQSNNSGILNNATNLRENIAKNIFKIKFDINSFQDIERINGADLLESLESSISNYTINEVIIICRSNKRANEYNKGFRNRILYREGEISAGDLLMVVKNNYYWLDDNDQIDFIANGDIVEIIKIHGFEELYGFRFADITIKLIDYQNIELRVKIILDSLMIDSASIPSEKNKELFYSVAEDYSELKTKKKIYKQVREDKYFNALQVKFAYAITCHKSQGGQWKAVYIDHGYLSDDMINKEYLRWLYTAVTRATEKLYLINFNDKYF